MNVVNVLKIMTCSDEIVLISANAIQNIAPISEYKVIRNINNKPINKLTTPLLKCTIKTTDIPNVDLLQLGGRYKIYSINTFKKTKEPDINHIQTEKNKLEYVYKPIFEMVLINFECTNNNDESTQQWIMQFVQP